MHSDSDHYRLIHIRDNIAFAMSFVEGMPYEQFRDDTKSFYAVTRALEIISEASWKLSAELAARQIREQTEMVQHWFCATGYPSLKFLQHGVSIESLNFFRALARIGPAGRVPEP